ncbi:hypothetical protein C8F01DRAFT_1146879 [Mycena amicta]|nr:hypothetical protein C8F01DRAFT_1146879 [Mycena amicta]
MSLVQHSPDTWTSTGVESTFDVEWASPFHGTTDICGWGWRFTWQPDSGTGFKVFFDPHLLSNAFLASYGPASFDISAENLLQIGDVDQSGIEDDPSPPLDSDTTPSVRYLGSWTRRILKHSKNPKNSKKMESIPSRLPLATPLQPYQAISMQNQPLSSRIRSCLANTIQGGEAIDVKFYAYNCVGDGHVLDPRPLFGNLALMRGVSSGFDKYLEGFAGTGTKFSESELIDIDEDDTPGDTFDGYDYMSDSDLDEEEKPEDSEENEEETDAPSDSATTSSSQNTALSSSTPVASRSARGRIGHRVVIKGHAYKTWNALLYYLYTDQIHFRDIGAVAENMVVTGLIPNAPQCSPKSMYKLADKYDLTELKSLSLASIRSQLSNENIVREVFSNFTSMFDEIKKMEVEFLLERLTEPRIRADVAEMLKTICDGKGSSGAAGVLQDILFGAQTRTSVTPPADRIYQYI